MVLNLYFRKNYEWERDNLESLLSWTVIILLLISNSCYFPWVYSATYSHGGTEIVWGWFFTMTVLQWLRLHCSAVHQHSSSNTVVIGDACLARICFKAKGQSPEDFHASLNELLITNPATLLFVLQLHLETKSGVRSECTNQDTDMEQRQPFLSAVCTPEAVSWVSWNSSVGPWISAKQRWFAVAEGLVVGNQTHQVDKAHRHAWCGRHGLGGWDSSAEQNGTPSSSLFAWPIPSGVKWVIAFPGYMKCPYLMCRHVWRTLVLGRLSFGNQQGSSNPPLCTLWGCYLCQLKVSKWDIHKMLPVQSAVWV